MVSDTRSSTCAVLTQARSLVHFAHRHGYGREELIQMIRDLPQDA
jgi:hypothetical protein